MVCDSDGHICNFWRAVQHDPEAVARHADYPTIHQDLTARHTWLRRWGAEHAERLSSDPEFYDPKRGRVVGVGDLVVDRRRVVR